MDLLRTDYSFHQHMSSLLFSPILIHIISLKQDFFLMFCEKFYNFSTRSSRFFQCSILVYEYYQQRKAFSMEQNHKGEAMSYLFQIFQCICFIYWKCECQFPLYVLAQSTIEEIERDQQYCSLQINYFYSFFHFLSLGLLYLQKIYCYPTYLLVQFSFYSLKLPSDKLISISRKIVLMLQLFDYTVGLSSYSHRREKIQKPYLWSPHQERKNYINFLASPSLISKHSTTSLALKIFSQVGSYLFQAQVDYGQYLLKDWRVKINSSVHGSTAFLLDISLISYKETRISLIYESTKFICSTFEKLTLSFSQYQQYRKSNYTTISKKNSEHDFKLNIAG